MVGYKNPVSITESEFLFIRDFIRDNNLQSGYECATAFGVSALAAGLGFKETGGFLYTMDCYIEELFKDCTEYRGFDFDKLMTNKAPVGLDMCLKLIEHYEIPVKPVIGVSPRDIPPGLYDYVFIDAEHTTNAVKNDLIGIKPYLADKYSVFIHDYHCFNGLDMFILQEFGQSIKKDFVRGENYNLIRFGL